MHKYDILTSGIPIGKAEKAIIMIHGRGASAEDIISFAPHLTITGFAIIAPRAVNNTWYPLPFLANPSRNEPWLSSALQILNEIVINLESHQILREHIYIMGFSQGACLALEFATRNATRWGGIIAFSGGLIGDRIYTENYHGKFHGTPVFIGSSDPDSHIPVERVKTTTALLKEMDGDVKLKIYEKMGHTVSKEEILEANSHVFKLINKL